MRKALILVGVTAAFLSLASIADAKGPPTQVEVAGPGLEAPIVLGEKAAAVYENWVVGYGEGLPQPRGDIGPRYAMRVEFFGLRERAIVQYLYPFAPGQPLVHTPPGQRHLGQPLPRGWAAADRALMDILRQRGLPRSAPEDPASAGPALGSRTAIWPIAIVVLTASFAAMVGLRTRRAALARPR